MTTALRVSPAVAAALRDGRPVVALESSVFAQGLPQPHNREAANRMLAAVRAWGAEPAITGVARGVPTVGLGDDALDRFLARDGVRKVSARDIALAAAAHADGATTVAASLALANAAGIAVFATGGIGGVHRVAASAQRDAVRDESADLEELARTPLIVVCAGAKTILDLPATMERLETLGVAVLGYDTEELPGFLTRGTGISLAWRVDNAAEIAAAWHMQRALGRTQALVVVQAPPVEFALPRDVVDSAVERALEAAARANVHGAALTPWLLSKVEQETGGASLAANVALLESNAALAAEIAVQVAKRVEIGRAHA